MYECTLLLLLGAGMELNAPTEGRGKEDERARGKSGLTLEGLAHRLEELEGENERLRAHNTELERKVALLEGSGISGSGISRAQQVEEGLAAEFHAPPSTGEQEEGKDVGELAFRVQDIDQRLSMMEHQNTDLWRMVAKGG